MVLIDGAREDIEKVLHAKRKTPRKVKAPVQAVAVA
jgi:hypothetical protein